MGTGESEADVGSRTGSKLRFGILCHGTDFPAWEADCIRGLIDSGVAEPALLIRELPAERATSADEGRPSHTGVGRWRHALFAAFQRFWVARRARALRTVSLEQELDDVPGIACSPVCKGRFSQYFRESDVEILREHKLDFILRFAFNILRGDVLDVARYGMWSFHHDDETRYRGRPPCYWRSSMATRSPVPSCSA